MTKERGSIVNYAQIKEYDIANGPGVRLSLFVSGCSHHCKGCFQPQTWDPEYGVEFTDETEDRIITAVSDPCYQGMTFLGGEPMEAYNQKRLLHLAKRFKETLPDKDLWCFTGYLYDTDLLGDTMRKVPETRRLLSCIDVLVDGEFIEEQKDITLLFKGSANQRTIDLRSSEKEGRIVIWTPDGVSVSAKTHL